MNKKEMLEEKKEMPKKGKGFDKKSLLSWIGSKTNKKEDKKENGNKFYKVKK